MSPNGRAGPHPQPARPPTRPASGAGPGPCPHPALPDPGGASVRSWVALDNGDQSVARFRRLSEEAELDTKCGEPEFPDQPCRVLLCIAPDPSARLRDIAASLGITERSVYGIVTDLTVARYVVKHIDGRRNLYQIQAHLPLPEPASEEPAIGEVLALLRGSRARQQPSEARPT